MRLSQAEGGQPDMKKRVNSTRKSTHTSHLDEESGPCFALGGCELYRNSSPSTPQSTTTSTRSAISIYATTSNSTALLLWSSGAVSSQPGIEVNGELRPVSIRLTAPARLLKLFAELSIAPNYDHASSVVDYRLPDYVVFYENIRPHLSPI
jgi:hypothetical protein